MMSAMMDGWGWGMMLVGSLFWLLIVVLVILAIAALAKYVFSRRD